MPPRRALLIGASGLVGTYLHDAFRPTWEVLGTYRTNPAPGLVQLDMLDPGAVEKLARDFRPDVVLCPAAEPNVDKCEQDPPATRHVNLDGTRAVADAAHAVGALFAYFSTDYVFDGEHGPYTEDATCHPVNEYGRQKAACEEITRRSPNHLVLRVSAVYGWEAQRKNYVVRMIERLRKGERAKAWVDQILTPTYAPNLGVMVRELVDSGATGTYHACGGRSTDRFTFSRQIAEAFGLDASLIDGVTSEEFQPTPTVRPKNVGLSTAKLRARIATAPLPPAEGLAAMRALAGTDPRAF